MSAHGYCYIAFCIYTTPNKQMIYAHDLTLYCDPKSALIDFTLSNARRFYSSKGDPLGLKV